MNPSQTILLVTTQPDRFTAFSDRLAAQAGVRLLQVDSAAAALEAAVSQSPVLVITDQLIGQVPALTLVRQLMARNAFIHTAVVSDLDAEAFHESSEGLGVLAQLPAQPGQDDADALLALLRRMVPAP